MNEEKIRTTYKTVTFSKDNPVAKIPLKQSQTQEQNIKPPNFL